MNKLERLEAWADELGNGALWHEWGVPDLKWSREVFASFHNAAPQWPEEKK